MKSIRFIVSDEIPQVWSRICDWDYSIQQDTAMSLSLINLYSTQNLGDAAIYASLARLSPTGKVTGTLHEPKGTRINGFTNQQDNVNHKGFISVGGDIFNNARPLMVTRRFLQNVSALRQQPSSTMLFGQSIPRSCRNLAFRYLAASLKKLGKVAVRDEESHRRLTDAGVNAVLSYDTAFALEPQIDAQAAAKKLYDDVGLTPERTAIISLRNQSSLYGNNDGDKQLYEIATRLSGRGHQIGLLVQADGDAADSDRSLAASLLKQIPGAKILDPFQVSASLEPWAVMTAALGLANIVVAVRYHAAVLRLVEGRSAFVLHYSNKGLDLSQRMKMPGHAFGSSVSNDLIFNIETTASSSFDPTPFRHHVRQCFSHGLKAIAA
jgi:polysaccharide pyruvyl transferase WcaK-like protein